MRLSKARKACVEAMMRDTIYDATRSLIEERGTLELTMNRVATKIGVATASLYNYFRDKDELVQYCYTRMVEPFFQVLDEIIKTDLPASQKLARILETALAESFKHQGLMKLLAKMGYDAELRKSCRPRLVQALIAIFEQGIQEGSLRPLNTTDLSRMFVGCLSELFDQQASGAPESEVRRFAGSLMEAVLRGTHAEKGPGGENAPSPPSNP